VRSFLVLSSSLLFVALSSQAQVATLPLWPSGTPEPWSPGAEVETMKPTDKLVGGHSVSKLSNIEQPSLALYQPPKEKRTGAAVVVFPGGGYRILAQDLEGTEVCEWLNAEGIACVLVKYRVPLKEHYPASTIDLEDAQKAVRLTRMHAAEWGINPSQVGVLGFSAGGHLAAVLSNHADFKRAGEPADEASVSARPDFTVLIYPAYLTDASLKQVDEGVKPTLETPPTFLLQAEDDPVHEENVLVYFQALKDAKVKAELHVYAEGGHGYGLRANGLPIVKWPSLVTTWLHTIGILH